MRHERRTRAAWEAASHGCLQPVPSTPAGGRVSAPKPWSGERDLGQLCPCLALRRVQAT